MVPHRFDLIQTNKEEMVSQLFREIEQSYRAHLKCTLREYGTCRVAGEMRDLAMGHLEEGNFRSVRVYLNLVTTIVISAALDAQEAEDDSDDLDPEPTCPRCYGDLEVDSRTGGRVCNHAACPSMTERR